jgi:uncharacterized membrane protein
MPTLIAVAYQDETSAAVAGEELVRLSPQLAVRPDDVAVLTVEPGGLYRATTRVSDSGRPGSSLLWAVLLGELVLEPDATPARAEMAVLREGLGVPAVPRFAAEVRLLLGPGASALFVLVGEGDADAVLGALARYGGRPLRASWASDPSGSAA